MQKLHLGGKDGGEKKKGGGVVDMTSRWGYQSTSTNSRIK